MTRRIILVDIGQGLTLSGVLPSAALNTAYSAQLTARGGNAPYVYTIAAGALPTGLALDAATGIISGTGTVPGAALFTVRATDLSGAFVDRVYSITIIAEPLSLSGSAPAWTVGTAYSYTYTAAHGVPPYTWSLAAGALPAGITLNASTGEISGTPTVATSPAWTVRVSDSDGTQLDLRDNATLQLVGDFDAATVGAAYSSDIDINGGDLPYSNSSVTVGALPAGLTLSIVSGKLRLSGTPTTAATTAFTVSVDSGDGQSASSNQSVTAGASSWYAPIFAAGGDGIALDFNDLSSMFQDIAHTMPVTAAGQTVKAVQCKQSGNWLTSSTGSILAYDATRAKHKLVFSGGEAWKMTAPSALLGTVDRSLTCICTLPNAANKIMASIGAAGTGTHIFVGNDDSGLSVGTWGSGGAARAGRQQGFAVYTGWAPAVGLNRGRVYRGATDLGHGDTLNSGISIASPFAYVGDYSSGGAAFTGDYFGVLLISRLLTPTEMQSIVDAFA